MTREEAIRAAQVMLAWANGAEVEVKVRSAQAWQHSHARHPTWNWKDREYRLKPATEPTLRPWNEDEVPLGARLRVKGRTAAVLLTDTSEEADRERWLDHYEHSLDGGKTWLPCGVDAEK